MKPRQVDLCNLLQAQQSERQVFSVRRDFELAQAACAENKQGKKCHELSVHVYVQFENFTPL